MHSRIFEIVKVEDGADYNSYMKESDFYDYIPYKFDYVYDGTVLEEDIDWLKGCCKCLFVGEDIIEISKTNKEKYFENRFEDFKRIAENMTLEEFATGHNEDWSKSLYRLKENIRDEYGFYVWDGTYLDCLDDFVRNEDGRYKIVGSMDYHW